MTLNTAAAATARRNLGYRIDQFLKSPAAQTMTAWQANHVLQAIAELEGHRYAEGERTMMRVEKAAIYEPLGYGATEEMDANQLMDRFERALRGVE